jgi:hypothetical protein
MRLLGSACVIACVLLCGGARGGDEVPAREAGTAGSESGSGAQRCETCHTAEHAEWLTSRHAAAWVDPIFQAEFAHGRPAWCVGCHAPLASGADDPRAAEGVGCEGCHPRGDGAGVGSPEACARCHEFNFPVLGEHGRLERYTDQPMQATVSQWRASGMSEAVECGDCHRLSPAGHAFSGSHDADMVAGALDLSLCRADRTIAIAVTNRGAAHNVPSGGVHRHMALRAWRSSAPERMADDFLGRRFRLLPDGGKRTTSDTTIAPGGTHRTELALASLGGTADEPVNVELRYVYARDETADLDHAVLSRVIHQRRVAPADLPRCE